MAVYTCTFRGTISQTAFGEIFSHSLTIDSTASQAAVAQKVHDEWKIHFESAAGLHLLFGNLVSYTEVTAAQVLEPNPPVNIAAATHVLFEPPLLGTGGNMLPPQCALVVSFTAGKRPNGMPLKGRTYLPPLATNFVSNDGLFTQTGVDNAMGNFMLFFTALKNANMHPCIWSRTYEQMTPQHIDQIRVGNFVDTMRSRRNAKVETYTSSPVAP